MDKQLAKWAARKRQSPTGIIGFISQHFVAVSALAVAVAVLAATIFLYAYLSVFDWRLIWIIEYTDVLKVGIVAIAVISGFAYWIWSVIDDTAVWITAKTRRPLLIALGVWSLSLIGFLMGGYYFLDEPRYALHIWAHFSILCIAILTARTIQIANDYPDITLRVILNDIVLVVFTIGSFGRTFGYYTRDIGGFTHEIVLNDGQHLTMGLVMVTSHHVILHDEWRTVVVPTADIVKIEKWKKPEE